MNAEQRVIFTPSMASEFISATARNVVDWDAVRAWRIASMDRPTAPIVYAELQALVRAA